MVKAVPVSTTGSQQAGRDITGGSQRLGTYLLGGILSTTSPMGIFILYLDSYLDLDWDWDWELFGKEKK